MQYKLIELQSHAKILQRKNIVPRPTSVMGIFVFW